MEGQDVRTSCSDGGSEAPARRLPRLLQDWRCGKTRTKVRTVCASAHPLPEVLDFVLVSGVTRLHTWRGEGCARGAHEATERKRDPRGAGSAIDGVASDLVQEAPAADPEEFRGVRPVAVRLLQRLLDEIALDAGHELRHLLVGPFFSPISQSVVGERGCGRWYTFAPGILLPFDFHEGTGSIGNSSQPGALSRFRPGSERPSAVDPASCNHGREPTPGPHASTP